MAKKTDKVLTPKGTNSEEEISEKTPEVQENAPETVIVPEKKPEQPEVDYKEKFSESTRENQVLRGQLAELNQRLGEVAEAKPPTDEELAKTYPEWESATDLERKLLTETLKMKKQIAATQLLAQEMAKASSFNIAISEILSKPEFAGIRGREVEFRAYCDKPTHKGTSPDVLARAFLFDLPDDEKPEKPVTEPAPVPQPSVLERGGGHSQAPEPPSDNAVMSDEEAAELRKRDPKKYNELVRQGKLK